MTTILLSGGRASPSTLLNPNHVSRKNYIMESCDRMKMVALRVGVTAAVTAAELIGATPAVHVTNVTLQTPAAVANVTTAYIC